MTVVSSWTAQLAGLPLQTWPAFLARNSGLPGPRANLALAQAVALRATPEVIDVLLTHDDPDEVVSEYVAMCAATALGRGSDDPALAQGARACAADARWRVREGVATGLQLLGDIDLDALRGIVARWLDDPDPLVVRAAVAAICEPRLLRAPAGSRAALDACLRATDRLASLPADRRRDADARTLRQALGYCWSVAVAADPVAGLPVFSRLETSDADIAWIVKENRGKKRLSSLL